MKAVEDADAEYFEVNLLQKSVVKFTSSHEKNADTGKAKLDEQNRNIKSARK